MPESIVKNVSLPIIGRLARLGVLNRDAEREVATEEVADMK